MPTRPPRVVIIGGGLAGMVVAKALAERQIEVVIAEASARLGGKAGADRRTWTDAGGRARAVHVEHGYHIFAGWYRNTRRLLDDLGVSEHLIDSQRQCFVLEPETPGAAPRVYDYFSVRAPGDLLHNVFATALPWHQALTSFYFLLDLAAEPFSNRGFLDRVSVSGFFRSRFYRHEAIADFHHESVLQSQAIPFHELSAMTLQKAMQSFLGTPSPFVSFFDGDLQTRFIAPFRTYLRERGVTILLKQRFDGDIPTLHGDLEPMFFPGGRRAALVGKGDICVLATPPEFTARCLSDAVVQAEDAAGPRGVDTTLSGVAHLDAVPMAAMQLYFDRRLAGVPEWHSSLYRSKYGISFIDVSRHWPSLRREGRTVLSVVAANLAPLRGLEPQEQVGYLVRELCEYLGLDIEREALADAMGAISAWEVEGDIVRFRIAAAGLEGHYRPNLAAPLFLNTAGAWQHRPQTRTSIRNLYVAGDYCRSEADLATMESAVMSGLTTAHDILADLGMDTAGVAPLPLELPPRWALRALTWALFPVVAPIGVAYAAERALRQILGRE